MKTVYKIIINQRDDHIYSHDTISCKVLEIDESSKRVTEYITKVDGSTLGDSRKKIEYLVNGKYAQFDFNDEYFETLEEVKRHIQHNYHLVMSTKHDFLFLVDDDDYNSVVAITNYEDGGYGCSDEFINLQKLLKLEHKE